MEPTTQGPIRLSKILSQRGICSRREADEYISKGWVLVDGVRIRELGTRVLETQKIELAPEARRTQGEKVTILLHKPIRYVSGLPEDGYEPAVVLITPENQMETDDRPGRSQQPRLRREHFEGLAPAGRLDIDSTGLIVFTQDGRVAKQLIGENSDVEKEYLVRVVGDLSEDGLKLLNHGLTIEGRKLRPAHVEWINDDQLRFVLREGMKRQIRRMCEAVGLQVVGLKRVRIGNVRLGRLPEGQWRFLGLDESF